MNIQTHEQGTGPRMPAEGERMPSHSGGGTPALPGRSPILAAILSGFFPGLGQWYNRQRGKAVLFAVAGVVTGFGPLSPLDVDIDLSNPTPGLHHVLIASLPFLGIALWSVVDAYRCARPPAGAHQ